MLSPFSIKKIYMEANMDIFDDYNEFGSKLDNNRVFGTVD